jgi:hypothetical protein
MAERWPKYRQLRGDRLRRVGRFLKDRGRTAEAAACIKAAE